MRWSAKGATLAVMRIALALAALGAAVLTAVACSSDEGETASNAAFGGNGGGGTGGGDSSTLSNVTIEPASVTTTVELGKTAQQAYKAFAQVAGQLTDVTTQCTWDVPAEFGAFSGAQLTLKAHGGVTQVTATCGGATAQSPLTVKLIGQISDATAPANAASLFAGAQASTDATQSPLIEYPLDGAVAPRNIPSVEAQWAAPVGDVYHVRLSNQHLELSFFTGNREAKLTELEWQSVTSTIAGASVTFEVEALDAQAPATKYVSQPVVLNLSKDSIDDTAIYWWASSQGELLEQTFSETDAPTSIKGSCTSCHSVSRSGKRIGYSRCVAGDCNQLFGGFMRFDEATKTWVEAVDADNKQIQGSYSTFAPVGYPFADDTQSVALFALATNNLELYDPDTGAVVPSNVATVSRQHPSDPNQARTATMPDWSPDGKSVVFASTPTAGQWIDVGQSAIATMSYAFNAGSHTFGTPKFLVSGAITLPSGSYDNFFFPSYSPDGSLIVFNAARGPWRNFQVASSPGQRLMLTNASGDWNVELAQMNGQGDLDITWPHWAPSASSDYLWIVFASQRDYGHRLTTANTTASCVGNGVLQCKQIWIGAVAKNKLPGAGATSAVDPSAPPVWMPGQEITANNISPYWTLPSESVVR